MSQRSVLCQTVQVRGAPSAKSSITGDPMANTSCPFIALDDGHVPPENLLPKVKNHRISSSAKLNGKLAILALNKYWLRINPRRCEACDVNPWSMDYERKIVEYLTKLSDRTSEGRFCDRHQVKPNRKARSPQHAHRWTGVLVVHPIVKSTVHILNAEGTRSWEKKVAGWEPKEKANRS